MSGHLRFIVSIMFINPVAACTGVVEFDMLGLFMAILYH